MQLIRRNLVALALPLAFSTACPGDDSSGDGTTTDATGTTTDDPGTTDDAGTTTDDPGTTDGDTTSDPSSSSGEPVEESRVRVMHLGVGAPGVDVYANGAGPVFENLVFRASTQYETVPSDTYTFDVTVTGDPIEDAVLSPELTLDPDTAYTAVAIGDLAMTDGAPGLSAIALVDDAEGIPAGSVRLNVVHAAPAVGQVDVWLLTDPPMPLLTDVDYGTAAPLEAPAAVLEIGIDANDDMVPDLTYTVDASVLDGGQANVYANNDETGTVSLVVQLGDGSVLAIPPNP